MNDIEIESLMRIMLDYGDTVQAYVKEVSSEPILTRTNTESPWYDRGDLTVRDYVVRIKLYRDEETNPVCWIDVDVAANNLHELILDSSVHDEKTTETIIKRFNKEVLKCDTK